MKQLRIEITYENEEELSKSIVAVARHIAAFYPILRSGKIISIHGLSRWRVFEDTEIDMLNIRKLEE